MSLLQDGEGEHVKNTRVGGKRPKVALRQPQMGFGKLSEKIRKELKQAVKKRCPRCGHHKAWTDVTKYDLICTKCTHKFREEKRKVKRK